MASDNGQNSQARDDKVLQYVTFRLDDETYGIDVMQIQEVLRYTEIAPDVCSSDLGYPGGFRCRGGIPESQ